MSTPPSASTAASTMALTEALELVSTVTGTTVPCVSAASSVAVACSASWPRDATTTLHASSASALATALPMPMLPPVTIARLSCSCRSMAAILAHRRGSRSGRGDAVHEGGDDLLPVREHRHMALIGIDD